MSSEEIQIVESPTPSATKPPRVPKARRVVFDEPDEEPEEEYDEDETEDEEEDSEDEEEDDGMVELLANTLATPEGDTVCGALVQISQALETQNKILIKMLSAVSKK